MSKLREEVSSALGRRVVLICAGAALLVLTAALAWALQGARAHQRELETALEVQRAALEALEKEEPKKEEGPIHEGTPQITGDTIREQLSGVGELVSMEYLYTNADKYENQNQVTVFQWEVGVPFTAKSFLLSYDGRIKAGITMEDVAIQMDGERHTVAVTLPRAAIVSHEIFEDNIRVFDEKDGIFNKITVENYADFISGQKTVMERRAVELGLLDSADRNARAVVRSLLSSLPGMEAYSLTVSTRR